MSARVRARGCVTRACVRCSTSKNNARATATPHSRASSAACTSTLKASWSLTCRPRSGCAAAIFQLWCPHARLFARAVARDFYSAARTQCPVVARYDFYTIKSWSTTSSSFTCVPVLRALAICKPSLSRSSEQHCQVLTCRACRFDIVRKTRTGEWKFEFLTKEVRGGPLIHL